MPPSRRLVLTAGSTALMLHSASARAKTASGIAGQIKAMFSNLPGTCTLRIWAPAAAGAQEFSVGIHPDKRVFVASAFKGIVLAARLNTLDSSDIVRKLEDNELDLDEDVFSLGSPIFNPPKLTGKVSERTAAEAMIMHSDNTGTDMIMKVEGASTIRKFISRLGLTQTQIPDSTRVFGAYLFGLQNYQTATYAEVLAAAQRGAPLAHPFLNNVQTLASTANDFISLYSQTLPDGFFQTIETLNEYRRILALADGVFEAVPLGTSGFAKTGYSDYPGFHARSNAGAMTFDGHWVYFATIINWDAPEDDPETVAEWKAALRSSLKLIYEHLSSDDST
jgi:beta-lactamase class A